MSVDSDLDLGLALRFAVTIDGKDLGNWSKVEGLDVTWDIAEHRVGDGGNFRYYFPGADKSMTAHVELHDATNTAVAHWVLEGVLPVHYSGPRFDASASSVATEVL